VFLRYTGWWKSLGAPFDCFAIIKCAQNLGSEWYTLYYYPCYHFYTGYLKLCRCPWPRGLRCRSAAACRLRLWVWIPPGSWVFVVIVVFCRVVRKWSLKRADRSSRGVLPIVVRLFVWSRNLKNREAMTRVEPHRHTKRNIYNYTYTWNKSSLYGI